MISQLTFEQVRWWLDSYIAAWRSYQPDEIAALFTEDVRYEPEPYHELAGREAVVQAWLDDQDPLGSWEALYEPIAIDGWLAVATGTSRYHGADDEADTVFHNMFLLEFDPDGRGRHYREWYMQEPA
ncbi:MAG TPA: nuclear transport factor 2 family protein [Euzebyales bacterium]|nr:nuclear transport factor 2 family protein [Euzebyales bacterium]